MDNGALGKLIKDARLAKKMTQAEVVGDFITRNMLSQIESGTATPSVKTLEYLCRVLEIPMTAILPTDDVGDVSEVGNSLPRLKDLYFCEKYEQVIEFKSEQSAFNDEINAIKAKANLALAIKLSDDDSADVLQKALQYAKAASELSQIGIYSNDAVKAEALIALSNIAQKLTEYYKDFIN